MEIFELIENAIMVAAVIYICLILFGGIYDLVYAHRMKRRSRSL